MVRLHVPTIANVRGAIHGQSIQDLERPKIHKNEVRALMKPIHQIVV